MSAAVSDDNGKTWRKLGNIAENPKAEYTNLDCFFTKNGDAVLTYLYAEPAWNRKAIDLKAALIPKLGSSEKNPHAKPRRSQRGKDGCPSHPQKTKCIKSRASVMECGAPRRFGEAE